MGMSPDHLVFWSWGFLSLNLTIVLTWIVMAVLTIGSWLVTRQVSSGTDLPPWQNALEAVIETITGQLEEAGLTIPGPYLGFLGTLFLFIATGNIMSIIPGFESPAASLSTTSALALCVFLAVPFYGIRQQGVGEYLRSYARPTILLAPFHVMSEMTRTIALAVRLFGNVMSESVVAGLLSLMVPLFVPVVLKLFGLVLGLIHAYIFAILATVFIAAATSGRH